VKGREEGSKLEVGREGERGREREIGVGWGQVGLGKK